MLLEAVSAHSTLRQLGLAWSGLEEAAACALGALLHRNRSVTAVDVSHNNIGPEGAIVIGFGLSANSTLTHLDLSCNPLGQRGLAAVLMRGAAPGRTLIVDHGQPTLCMPPRRVFNEDAPGGHYELSLDRPYDRWVAQQVVQVARKPKFGEATRRAALLDRALINGERVGMGVLLRANALGAHGRMRGKLVLDLSVTERKPLLTTAVRLDLSDARERNLAHEIAGDVLRFPMDSWSNVTVSGKRFEVSWKIGA